MTTKTKQVMEEEIENLSYDGRIIKGGIGVLTEQQEQAVRRSIIRILETAMEEGRHPKKIREYPDGTSLEKNSCLEYEERIQSILNSVKE